MNIENYIETQYRELFSFCTINLDYIDLYSEIKNQKLKEILSILHYGLIDLFKMMNERLPTNDYEAHYWAEPSRQLIKIIEMTLGLFNTLKNGLYAFEIDEYYLNIIKKCRKFLSTSGGSVIPPHTKKIVLYYTTKIFIASDTITINRAQTNISHSLKMIGNGSYANVYRYEDTFYDKYFVLKRAKEDLTEKELKRFKLEFEVMKDFSSPYIPEVYCYNDEKNEYIMEYMDCTLASYIQKNNNILSQAKRKNIVNQILKAFKYIHSKGKLHRDISPKNILLKKYENILVVKIADFGLVKTPESDLTTANTAFKGYFNDPSLVTDGFDIYNILHETFAITRIVYYVLTGKTNASSISDTKLKEFVEKGLSPDKSLRFQSVDEITIAFKLIS